MQWRKVTKILKFQKLFSARQQLRLDLRGHRQARRTGDHVKVSQIGEITNKSYLRHFYRVGFSYLKILVIIQFITIYSLPKLFYVNLLILKR